jgi:hypothetical protein
MEDIEKRRVKRKIHSLEFKIQHATNTIYNLVNNDTPHLFLVDMHKSEIKQAKQELELWRTKL